MTDLTSAGIYYPTGWQDYSLAISNVASYNVTDTSATLSWFTNLPATTTLDYDNSLFGSDAGSITNAALTQLHIVSLSDLDAVATYNYTASSQDLDSNQASDSDNTLTTGTSVATIITDEDIASAGVTPSSSDGNTTFTIATQATNGSASIVNNQLVYTPNANYNGSDSFTYTATNNVGGTAIGTCSVTINPVNDGPAAASAAITCDEDDQAGGRATPVVTDVDDNSHTFIVLTQPANGSAVVVNNELGYTPTTANFNGSDSFTFSATDSGGLSVSGTATVTVNPVNDGPTATSATIITNEDTASGWTTVSLTDVDLQNEGDNYTISIVNQPSSGSAVASGDEAIYTPNDDFNGSDSFTYTVTDSGGLSVGGTATVTVNPVNDGPTATSTVIITTDEDTVSAGYDPVVTDVDLDYEGDSYTFTILNPASDGTAIVENDQLAYVPNANFNGSDSFTYTATDSGGLAVTGDASVTVNPVNDPPVADAQSVSTYESTAVAITLTASDVDTGDTWTYAVVSNPSSGALSGFDSTSGAVTYTPTDGFCGLDSFTFKAHDGTEHGNTATISISTEGGFGDAISMNYSREYPTATLLADGRVLVMGPQNATGEIFDPTGNNGAGSFTTTASAANNIYYRPATLLNDGRVLFSGGSYDEGGYYATAEIFDPAGDGGDGSFTATGAMANERYRHTTTRLADGRVLIAAGSVTDGSGTEAEIFDPDTGSFTATGSLNNTARYGHTATLLPDGRVLFTGGYSDGPLNTAEIFDPAGNGDVGSFTATGTLTNARYRHTATLLFDGRVLITGGTDGSSLNSAEIFNPAGNGGVGSFSSTDSLAGARSNHAAILLADGRVLINGGKNSVNLTSAEIFDPAGSGGDGSFTATGSLTTSRREHAVTLLADGRALIVGGGITAEIYYPVGWQDYSLTISSVASYNITDTGATVSWFTNLPATTSLDYGNFPHGVDSGTVLSPALTQLHVVSMSDLDPVSTYSYELVSQAVDGSSANDDGGFNVPSSASITIDEDTTSAGVDPSQADGSTTFAIATQPDNGMASVVSNQLVYEPDADFNGSDSFTYNATNSQGLTVTCTASVTINAINDAPTETSASITIDEDTSSGGVDPSISDVDLSNEGDTHTITITTQPSNGLADVASNQLLYVPNDDFSGSDSFTFTATDSGGLSVTGTCSVTVSPINDGPTATSATIITDEDTTSELTDPLVTDIDLSYEGDTYTLAITDTPTYGSINLVSNQFVYTPDANTNSAVNGDDSFSYTVTDSGGLSVGGTGWVTVNAVDDAPVANAQSVTTYDSTAVAITLTASDIDTQAENLTYSIVDSPSGGTLSGTAPDMTYTPTGSFCGPDSFTFTANDGNSDGNTATVSISVENGFGVTASLPTSTQDHTATLLPDGGVLLAGYRSSVFVFDPAGNGDFSYVGELDGTIYRLAEALLADGRVLLTGGRLNSAATNTALIFDPDTDSLTTITATLAEARSHHTATTLADGRVLITGGSDSDYTKLATAEIFDPAGNEGTGSFTSTASLSEVRTNHQAILLADGRVLIAGGGLTSAEIFDPAGNMGAGSFTDTGALSTGRYSFTATLLLDGRVLFSGGSYSGYFASAEIFDPAGNGNIGSFSATGSLNNARSAHKATLLSSGLVLITGGSTSAYLDSVEIFDPAGNGNIGSFTETTSLISARSKHTSTLLADGRVLITGGNNSGGMLTSTEIYYPVGWQDFTPTVSNVTSTRITDDQATISWFSNLPADSQVEYGTTTSYGTSVSTSSLNQLHLLELSGLTSETTYHYQVSSMDIDGNIATSADYTFTTAAP